MQKPISANTQYGDFFGTILIDGHHGAYAFDLAKKTEMPETFFQLVSRRSKDHPANGNFIFMPSMWRWLDQTWRRF